MLRISPRLGDTLRTMLEQTTEVTDLGGARTATSTSTVVYSQSIVRGVKENTTTVLTIVDSVRVTGTDQHSAKRIFDAQRALEGQRLVLQLRADGTVESARDGKGTALPKQVAEAMSAMPAVLPKGVVRAGDEWSRELLLPSGGPLGAKGSGKVRATFRLDSVQAKSGLAFVSMHGAIAADSASGVSISGSIAGSLQFDRNRGWMTDSRMLVMLKSIMTPPPGLGLAPMKLMTRVTQRLRTLGAR